MYKVSEFKVSSASYDESKRHTPTSKILLLPSESNRMPYKGQISNLYGSKRY
jgi:hypothetical protein